MKVKITLSNGAVYSAKVKATQTADAVIAKLRSKYESAAYCLVKAEVIA